MKWTKEAEQMLGKAPGFVRKMLTQQAETAAEEKQIEKIDAAFLSALMKAGKGHAARGFPAPKETDDPLREAFDRKFGIHAGMSDGEELDGDLSDTFFQALEADSEEAAMAYIHIPFCCTRCLFCGFYSEATAPAAMATHSEALEKDIALSGAALKKVGRKLSAVYFGGGTPTDLSADELSMLVTAVRRELPLTDDCEITIEGRLYDFGDEKVEAVLAAGANRFSFGVQSFDTEIRQQMGRKLPREELIGRLNRIVELSEPYRAAIVIDLIYGLPGQTEKEWIDSIDCAANETAIHGLDLYQINLIPSTPLAKQKDRLPPMADMREQSTLFSKGRKRMLDLGFTRLSTAHWGRDDRERNRYNLWNKRGIDCLPLGAGAGGRWGNVRFFQQSDVGQFKNIVFEGRKPIASASQIPTFGKSTSVAIGQLERQFLDLQTLENADALRPMVEQWQAAGLIEIGEPCRLTEAGEFWVLNLQQLISSKIKETATKGAKK
jgi:oxygen-independent coproporphyrinogen-3 oxidase